MNSVSDPPFDEAYKSLFEEMTNKNEEINGFNNEVMVECELPVINLKLLEESDWVAREECKSHIATASQEWGFFQVVNHGISSEILKRLRCKQDKLFKKPFHNKSKENEFSNFSAGSYRWGSPTATCITQLSWSESFHIPLTHILHSNASSNSLRKFSFQEYKKQVGDDVQKLGSKIGLPRFLTYEATA